MRTKASIGVKEFKALIGAVTKYPSIGAFADSETVGLQVAGDIATATAFGVVLSRARVRASGTLGLVGADERLLIGFASICPDKGTVELETVEKALKLRCGKKEITATVGATVELKLPAFDKTKFVKASKELAAQINYLAGIAYSDTSRPELSAVMLTGDGRAMAVDQKVVAVLTVDLKSERLAIPLQLAKSLTAGAVLYPGPRQTILRDGIAYYCIPTPAVAQKDFPVATVTDYGKQGRVPLAECSGSSLSRAISECNTLMSAVAKIEVALKLTIMDDGVQLTAESGGTHFRESIPARVSKPGDVLIIPLDRVISVAQFIQNEKRVELSIGKKNRETFISFGSGCWSMFPTWAGK